jgi:hypothetical protein
MAPLNEIVDTAARHLLARALADDYHALDRRDLTTNHTQRVTLGIIGAYTVIIAILWNIPYVSVLLPPSSLLPY